MRPKLWRVLGLAIAAFAFTAQSPAQTLTLADGPDQVRRLDVGDPAPAFTAYEVDGSPYAFDPAALERPTVLITFRGGWCPYCNGQLAGLRNVLPQLRAAVPGDRVEFLSAPS